jgi:hypothetical protein
LTCRRGCVIEIRASRRNELKEREGWTFNITKRLTYS